MKTIHIANTDYEFELTQSSSVHSIEEAWSLHSLCLQLQYLPLLYAESDDFIAVTQIPDSRFLEDHSNLVWRKGISLPSFNSFDEVRVSAFQKCLSWGPSKRVEEWCKRMEIPYFIPEWNVIQEVNSKAFSFIHSPKLIGSDLIWNASDLEKWMEFAPGKKVLKTCFGLSGRGHFFIQDHPSIDKLLQFCEKEWQQGRPLIGEPWVERVFDFSTQWFLDKKEGLNLIGPTVFESSAKGVYQATIAGDERKIFGSYIPFLQEHIDVARDVLQKVYEKGFYGHIGVDAFIFRGANKISLRPIVEINARQTMSLAALRFQRKWFPNQVVRMYFTPMNNPGQSLLPSKIKDFEPKRKLTFSLI